MKNHDTNSGQTNNVWEENPWNLPYDLDHVSRVRGLSLSFEAPDTVATPKKEESYAAKLAEIPQIFRDETRPAINDNSMPRGVTHNTPYSRLLSYIPNKTMRDDTGRTPATESIHAAISQIEAPIPVSTVEQTPPIDNAPATQERRTTPPEPDNISEAPETATPTPEVTRKPVSPRALRRLGGVTLVGVGFGLAKGIDWIHSTKKDSEQILPLPALPKKSRLSTFAKRSYASTKFSRDKKSSSN